MAKAEVSVSLKVDQDVKSVVEAIRKLREIADTLEKQIRAAQLPNAPDKAIQEALEKQIKYNRKMNFFKKETDLLERFLHERLRG